MFCILWPYILSVTGSNWGSMFRMHVLDMDWSALKLNHFILFFNFLSLDLGWYTHHVHKLHTQQRHRRDNAELHQHNVCVPLPHQLHGPTAQRWEHDQSWCQVSWIVCSKIWPWMRTACWFMSGLLLSLQNHHSEHRGRQLFCVNVTLQGWSLCKTMDHGAIADPGRWYFCQSFHGK